MNEIQDFTALIRRRECWWGVVSHPHTQSPASGPEGSKISNNWMWAQLCSSFDYSFVEFVYVSEKTHFPFHLLVFCSFSRLIHENLHVYNPYVDFCSVVRAYPRMRNNKLRRQPGKKKHKNSFPVPWMNCKQMSNDEWNGKTRETKTNENKFTTCNIGEEAREIEELGIRWMKILWMKRRRRGMKFVWTEYWMRSCRRLDTT